MDKLTFATAGSVDDGKSTLIGRLLYDADAITKTQKEYINNPKNFTDDGQINLSLLTDGLKSEKEQGITIDVAYKYFQTKNRRFIIADTPGHTQYTKNAITGISNAHLGIVLIDARYGITLQTKIHSTIFAMLKTPNIVVCINKMDMVNYDKDIFNKISNQYEKLAKQINLKINNIIPTSAFFGDNIVNKSNKTDWYKGQTLLQILETAPINNNQQDDTARFSVQAVLRPMSKDNPDYRGYAGRVNNGTFKLNDTVMIQPENIATKITKIEQYGVEIPQIYTGMSGTILLESNIDIDTGNIISKNPASVKNKFNANICWLGQNDLNTHKKYIIRHLTKFTQAIINSVNYKINIQNFDKDYDTSIKQNDIASVEIQTQDFIPVENFNENQQTGRFIIIDPTDNQTVAMGMAIINEPSIDFAV